MKKRPMSAEEIRRMTEELKEICKPGDRVELISPVDDPFDRIKPGDQGAVQSINDAGTVHVSWDNGSVVGLVFRMDHFKIIRSAGDITNEELIIDVFCVPSESDKVCHDLAGWKMDEEGKSWCERFCGKINDGEAPDMTCYKEWLKFNNPPLKKWDCKVY